MPSGNIGKFGSENAGLLTTVADLPLNFKLQYVSVETPLDLSVKTAVLGQITPPHSPQRSPLKKRPYHHLIEAAADEPIDTKAAIVKIEPTTTSASAPTTAPASSESDDDCMPPAKIPKKEVTPDGKQIKIGSMPKTQKSVASNAKQSMGEAAAGGAQAPAAGAKEHKRVKAVRKLKFDEKKSSPVSGTIIRALEEIDSNIPLESGDIDPQYNIVEVTEEAKAELAAIPNVIGAYLCKLCQIEFEDAFCLARHRCSCIVLLEYRCPECGKRFNCPANLASHRRWHKPKDEVMKKSSDGSAAGDNDENAVQYPCNLCGKFFKRQAYLRKHLVTHNKPNSKTNKRSAQTTPETSGSTTLSTLTTVAQTLLSHGFIDDQNAAVAAAVAAAAAAAEASTEPSTNGRSKSVCSDDSTSSSQDSIASSVRFTFNVNSSNDNGKSNDNSSNDNGLDAHSPPPPFRLFNRSIFTEEENIAAAALAHLRHAKDSVIRHTTALSI